MKSHDKRLFLSGSQDREEAKYPETLAVRMATYKNEEMLSDHVYFLNKMVGL